MDYYAVLGVPATATGDEIRAAYRRLALQWHPDRAQQRSHSDKAAAEAKFKQIGEAYSVLSDSQKREIYDAETRERRERAAGSFSFERRSPSPSSSSARPFSARFPGSTAFDPFDIFRDFFGTTDPFEETDGSASAFPNLFASTSTFPNFSPATFSFHPGSGFPSPSRQKPRWGSGSRRSPSSAPRNVPAFGNDDSGSSKRSRSPMDSQRHDTGIKRRRYDSPAPTATSGLSRSPSPFEGRGVVEERIAPGAIGGRQTAVGGSGAPKIDTARAEEAPTLIVDLATPVETNPIHPAPSNQTAAASESAPQCVQTPGPNDSNLSTHGSLEQLESPGDEITWDDDDGRVAEPAVELPGQGGMVNDQPTLDKEAERVEVDDQGDAGRSEPRAPEQPEVPEPPAPRDPEVDALELELLDYESERGDGKDLEANEEVVAADDDGGAEETVEKEPAKESAEEAVAPVVVPRSLSVDLDMSVEDADAGEEPSMDAKGHEEPERREDGAGTPANPEQPSNTEPEPPAQPRGRGPSVSSLEEQIEAHGSEKLEESAGMEAASSGRGRRGAPKADDERSETPARSKRRRRGAKKDERAAEDVGDSEAAVSESAGSRSTRGRSRQDQEDSESNAQGDQAAPEIPRETELLEPPRRRFTARRTGQPSTPSPEPEEVAAVGKGESDLEEIVEQQDEPVQTVEKEEEPEHSEVEPLEERKGRRSSRRATVEPAMDEAAESPSVEPRASRGRSSRRVTGPASEEPVKSEARGGRGRRLTVEVVEETQQAAPRGLRKAGEASEAERERETRRRSRSAKGKEAASTEEAEASKTKDEGPKRSSARRGRKQKSEEAKEPEQEEPTRALRCRRTTQSPAKPVEEHEEPAAPKSARGRRTKVEEPKVEHVETPVIRRRKVRDSSPAHEESSKPSRGRRAEKVEEREPSTRGRRLRNASPEPEPEKPSRTRRGKVEEPSSEAKTPATATRIRKARDPSLEPESAKPSRGRRAAKAEVSEAPIETKSARGQRTRDRSPEPEEKPARSRRASRGAKVEESEVDGETKSPRGRSTRNRSPEPEAEKPARSRHAKVEKRMPEPEQPTRGRRAAKTEEPPVEAKIVSPRQRKAREPSPGPEPEHEKPTRGRRGAKIEETQVQAEPVSSRKGKAGDPSPEPEPEPEKPTRGRRLKAEEPTEKDKTRATRGRRTREPSAEPEPAKKTGVRRLKSEEPNKNEDKTPVGSRRKTRDPFPEEAEPEKPVRSRRGAKAEEQEVQSLKSARGRKARDPSPETEKPTGARRGKSVVLPEKEEKENKAAKRKRAENSEDEEEQAPRTRRRTATRIEPETEEKARDTTTKIRARGARKSGPHEPSESEHDSPVRSSRSRATASAVHHDSAADDEKVDLILSSIHMGTHLDGSSTSTDVSTLFPLPIAPHSFVIRHAMATPLDKVGMQVWGGALVLAEYLLDKGVVQGKQVCELGTGTGFVGIVAAFGGATRVWATDRGGCGVLTLAMANVEKNGVAGIVKVKELDWRDARHPLLPTRDDPEIPEMEKEEEFRWTDDDVTAFEEDCTVLLAADVVYDGYLTERLVGMLKALLRPTRKGESRTLYLSIEKRPNFTLVEGKETVRAWDQFIGSAQEANESLERHGLPGTREKGWRMKMERVEVDGVPRVFEYERTRWIEVWRVWLERAVEGAVDVL